ncbi:MAG: hypothetical protein HC848_09185 [Limnobacter sp.]|nr:hypothetical protein [Limnobacter sp.]
MGSQVGYKRSVVVFLHGHGGGVEAERLEDGSLGFTKKECRVAHQYGSFSPENAERQKYAMVATGGLSGVSFLSSLTMKLTACCSADPYALSQQSLSRRANYAFGLGVVSAMAVFVQGMTYLASETDYDCRSTPLPPVPRDFTGTVNVTEQASGGPIVTCNIAPIPVAAEQEHAELQTDVDCTVQASPV